MGIFELPEGYSEIKKVDLPKDKKTAIAVNGGSVLILIALCFIGNYFVPFDFDIISRDLNSFVFNIIYLIIAQFFYIIGHEFIHGVFIKRYSGKKAKFGFTGLYAFAGSAAYFGKRQYLIIAFSPVVIFCAVLLLLNMMLPSEWFWRIYFIQIMNISGSAGDYYISGVVSGLPADILIKDEGVSMTIYSKKI